MRPKARALLGRCAQTLNPAATSPRAARVPHCAADTPGGYGVAATPGGADGGYGVAATPGGAGAYGVAPTPGGGDVAHDVAPTPGGAYGDPYSTTPLYTPHTVATPGMVGTTPAIMPGAVPYTPGALASLGFRDEGAALAMVPAIMERVVRGRCAEGCGRGVRRGRALS